MTNQLYILLGTNLGNRFENLQTASQEIRLLVGDILQKSRIYETAAWGITEQPSFLNQVLHIKTNLSPELTLKLILRIERKMGRKRSIKWGPRLIDIDILYFGKEIIDTEKLKIPHPFLQDRRFTLLPLAEIAPEFIHPIFNKSNKELLANCIDNSEVNLCEIKI